MILITTDQYQLIVDYKIMEGQKDAAQITPLKERIQHNYPGKKISAAGGLTKAFTAKTILVLCSRIILPRLCCPKEAGIIKKTRKGKAQKLLKSCAKHILL